MIYYSIPWSTEKNIGKYYNAFMEILPSENDFACFIDRDCMFTTAFFGREIEKIISQHPDCGIFTAGTNRIANKYQNAGLPHYVNSSNDIAMHMKIGELIFNDLEYRVHELPHDNYSELMGGFLILIKKSVWKKLGGFLENGILHVDNDLHLKAIKANEKILIMEGIYLFHWYRNGNREETKHLLK